MSLLHEGIAANQEDATSISSNADATMNSIDFLTFPVSVLFFIFVYIIVFSIQTAKILFYFQTA
jgi:hypothetical protein